SQSIGLTHWILPDCGWMNSKINGVKSIPWLSIPGDVTGDRLTTYFRYDKSVRKLIYTTNTIEGFHRQVRKVTKIKGAFTSDMALLKLIYLAHKNIKKKWTMPLANWGTTAQKLAIWFPGRMVLDLQ